MELATVRAETVKNNRIYMQFVTQTVLFLAKQNIAFRGHLEHHESLNRGNFLQLLELRQTDVPSLKRTTGISYTSPVHQNELLDLLASEITTAIVEEVSGRPFSIIVDETPCVSNKQQLVVSIR
jgi:hypothetical protein